MSKRQWIAVIGVWVMVFLFMGFRSSWYKPIAIVTGIVIVSIAYNLPQEKKKDLQNDNTTYVESNNKDKTI